MSATNFLSQAILNALFGRTSNFGAFTIPPNLHLAASTTTPTPSGGNFTEPGAGVSYARVDLNSANFTDATLADPSVLDNSSAITFPTASGVGWGTITHVGIFDALTGGNLLLTYPLTVATLIDAGSTLSVAAGNLDTTLT